GLGQLLRTYRLDPKPLEEIEGALTLFARYGARPGQVVVDLSLARGLRYYTGMVFEIYDDGLDGALQLCGGGRYDDLVRALGGRESVPACGFSIGLERTKLALERRGALPRPDAPVQVLVVPVTEDDLTAAIGAAESLRGRGLRVELELRGRGPRAALRYAAHEDVPLAVLVGERERTSGTALLRRLATREEREVPLPELPGAALAAIAAEEEEGA